MHTNVTKSKVSGLVFCSAWILVFAQGCDFETVDAIDGLHMDSIVNGEETNYEVWQGAIALLVEGNRIFCTGSLIHSEVVLCAGHCVLLHHPDGDIDFVSDPSGFYIGGGAETVDAIKYSDIEKVVTHPDWHGEAMDIFTGTDLSMFKLKTPVKVTNIKFLTGGKQQDFLNRLSYGHNNLYLFTKIIKNFTTIKQLTMTEDS